MFLSSSLPVENRGFIQPQDISFVLSELSRLGAPKLRSSRRTSADADMTTKRRNTLKWLSDWHLLAFLETTGMVSEEDLAVVIRAAVSPALDDPAALDAVITTDGWQTLMTIAQESAPAGAFFFLPDSQLLCAH